MNENVLVIFYLIIYLFNTTKSQDQAVIDRYEKMIKRNEEEAYHFDLPLSAREYKANDMTISQEYGTYDIVIVGGGTAGSILARRLSESKNLTVLLLEAGGFEDPFSVIMEAGQYLTALRYNWNFNTTQQKRACQGMIDKRCAYPRGKVLGGTGSINGEMYFHGNKFDHDEWAALGNSGWGHKDVFRYYIKSEKSVISDGDPGFHGTEGLWSVDHHRPISHQAFSAIQGSQIVQPQVSRDYNGLSNLGMFRTQFNVHGGSRHSTANAFLGTYNSSNLNILTNSYVTKVLTTGNTATGVMFTKNGRLFTANAKKEVVLSAGAINSPYILLHSGIGPKDQLTKLNIPVIADLPAVGQNLFDHLMFVGLIINTNTSEPIYNLREQIQQYLEGKGKHAEYHNQVFGFYNQGNETSKPEFEFVVLASSGNVNTIIQRSLKFNKDVYHALINAHRNPNSTFQMNLIHLAPKSKGSITLSSNDPFEYPIIEPNYLEDDEDIKLMLYAIQFLKKLLNTEPLRKLDAKLAYPDFPQCSAYQPGNDCYWRCVIRLLVTTGNHQCSTCRMGNNVKESVVNQAGRVHGVRKLRVADASIFPALPSVHINAVVAMVAEKIADQISSFPI